MKIISLIGVLLMGACAPPGYVYDTGSFIAHPADACARPEFVAGLVLSLNRIVGQSGGPTSMVNTIQGSASSNGSSQNISDALISCRGTLILVDGERESGIVKADHSNVFESAKVSWQSDAARDSAMQQRISEHLKQIANEQAAGLHRMTIADFELDKADLSPNKKLIITGYYGQSGNMEQLTQSVQVPSLIEGKPVIGLITTHAPRDTRASMQMCRSQSQYGCEMTLIGHADRCDQLLLGQTVNTDICLFVDGSR